LHEVLFEDRRQHRKYFHGLQRLAEESTPVCTASHVPKVVWKGLESTEGRSRAKEKVNLPMQITCATGDKNRVKAVTAFESRPSSCVPLSNIHSCVGFHVVIPLWQRG
jgi:hypothetical protein